MFINTSICVVKPSEYWYRPSTRYLTLSCFQSACLQNNSSIKHLQDHLVFVSNLRQEVTINNCAKNNRIIQSIFDWNKLQTVRTFDMWCGFPYFPHHFSLPNFLTPVHILLFSAWTLASMHIKFGHLMHIYINIMHIPVLLMVLTSVPQILYEFQEKVCFHPSAEQPPSWISTASQNANVSRLNHI